MKSSKNWQEYAKTSFGLGIFVAVLGVVFLAISIVSVITSTTGFSSRILIGFIAAFMLFGLTVRFYFDYREEKQTQKELEKEEEQKEKQQLIIANKQ